MAQIAKNITTIMTDGSAVFAGVKDLAAAELKPAIKAGAVGTGLFGATATVGLAALRFGLLTLALLFAYLYTAIFDVSYPVGLIFGFGTMALFGLLITVAFAVLGARQFKKVSGPREALQQVRETVLAVTNAATAGGAAAKAGVNVSASNLAAPAQTVFTSDEPPANYVSDPLL
ncbi:MAG: phage holin family protein [Propionibacteriaceae bacterium]|jgi:hypothetical protein|nr:phage holin family protein [Propionibacteriaceae bacterium]